MNKFVLDSLGAKVLICSTTFELYSLFQKMNIFSHLPDMQISSPNEDFKDYTVYYSESEERQFHYEKNNVFISYPLNEMDNGHSLLYIAGPLIEKRRQENSSLTCHAACLSKNGEAILLLGSKGSGKTTMALNLLMHGYSLVSNDICVIDYSNPQQLYALGGSKFINLRKPVIERSIPELTDFLQGNSEFNYKDNLVFTPKQLGFEVERNRVPITRMYILNVNNNLESLKIDTSASITSKLYLSEDFSRYIRGSAFYFINSQNGNIEGYIPSMDNEELCLAREQMINSIINDQRICNLSGSEGAVKKFLLK